MSSMLEEAIIDATALKEAAQKSAEEKIIEHFSKDIKEAVDIILEQDMMDIAAPGMGATMAPTQAYVPQTTSLLTAPADQELIDITAEGEDVDESEFVVKQVPYAATTSERDIVSIDLNKLEETIKRNLQENDTVRDYSYDDPIEEEFEFDGGLLEENGSVYQRDPKKPNWRASCYDNCMEAGSGATPNECYDLCAEEEEEKEARAVGLPGGVYEENFDPEDNETLEEMIRNILAEEAPIQEEFVEKTPAQRAAEKAKAEEKRRAPYQAAAKKYCEDFDERERPEGCTPKEARFKKGAAPLVKEHKQLNNKVKLLEEKLNKYKEVFPQLKQQLEESNLQGARLHYQNRILNSASLNERQKDRLVETISKANTVEEAKIIYETLQSAVGATALKRQPQSLNEVVTKSSSAFMPRKEEKRVDPLMVRMKALAGID